MDGVLLYTCCLLSHPHSTVRFLMNDLPLYFALTFLTILSPGAGVLFTVTSALRSGFQDAWQAPLGNVLASACVAVACAAGIGAILTASPLVFSIVQGLSALVLLYLAWRSWHAPANGFASQTLRLPSITRQHPLPNGRTAPRFLRQLFCCS
jgi:homoserine/homoserine lactone efflux protein